MPSAATKRLRLATAPPPAVSVESRCATCVHLRHDRPNPTRSAREWWCQLNRGWWASHEFCSRHQPRVLEDIADINRLFTGR